MDASPPPPPGLVEQAVNDWSERLLGREQRFVLGSDGVARVAPQHLELTPAQRVQLSHAVVVLVPGGPWPGVAGNGSAWIGPWSQALMASGVGYVGGVALLAGNNLPGGIQHMLAEARTHEDEARLAERVEALLRAHPLGPGGKLFLLAHSYGARPLIGAIPRLASRGIAVAGALVLGTYLPTSGHFINGAPATPRLLEVENAPNAWLTPLAGTRVARLFLPECSHMGLVLRPPDRLVEAVLREVAGDEL